MKLIAKIFLLIVLGSLLLPQGASWFTNLLDTYSNTIGLFVILAFIVIVLNREDLLGEGTKGITGEYVSDSGIKRTAKKLREDHIV